MADGITTPEAASRLGVSEPTVRSLLERGELSGVRDERGSRFRWRIDEGSLESCLSRRQEASLRRPASRLAAIEEELVAQRRLLQQAGVGLASSISRERDDLRAKVVELGNELAELRNVQALQLEADAERADVVERLLAALEAAERADSLRRRALAAYADLIAASQAPGHPGGLD